MQNTRPLELVFLTNFADYSYQSIPAIAQMADDFAVHLTIVHTMEGEREICDDAYLKLQSFFSEADLYADCTRRLMDGDPVQAVQRLMETQPVDLVIAPAADPLGLPRIGHRSLRARLMRKCGVPLWTIGRRTLPDKLRRSPRKIACWIDFEDPHLHHFAYALEYAWKLDVPLHILHPLPEIHEGALLVRGQPLHEEGAIREMRKRIGWSPVPLQYHVAEATGRRARTKLVEKSCADIVFLADQVSDWGSWLASKPALLDDCNCPVVCVPEQLRVPVWSLEHERRRPAAAVENRARQNGEFRTA